MFRNTGISARFALLAIKFADAGAMESFAVTRRWDTLPAGYVHLHLLSLGQTCAAVWVTEGKTLLCLQCRSPHTTIMKHLFDNLCVGFMYYGL